MELLFLLSIWAMFVIVRYSPEGWLYALIAEKHSQSAEKQDSKHEEENIEVSIDLPERPMDEYDKRIAEMKEELSLYNELPSDANIYAPGVYNIPHAEVPIEMEIEQEPSIEEEQEIGTQEISR